MKRIFWYSAMGEKDYIYLGAIDKLKKLGVTDVVIDFELTSNMIPKLLKLKGITPWYRIKLYTTPDRTEIIRWLNTCGIYECLPAIDAEPYSGSDVWVDNCYADDFIDILKEYHLEQEIVVYPEIMTGKKYRLYNYFLYKLSEVFTGRVHVLMELTYSKVFKLKKYHDENLKTLQNTMDFPVTAYVGVWPQSLWKIFRGLQLWIAKRLFNNLFFYTETKELM